MSQRSDEKKARLAAERAQRHAWVESLEEQGRLHPPVRDPNAPPPRPRPLWRRAMDGAGEFMTMLGHWSP